MMNNKFKHVKIIDVFNIRSSLSSYDYSSIPAENKIKGNIPYITRTEKNNGISKFITSDGLISESGNVITVGLDTQTVFYQEGQFISGQNIQIFENIDFNMYHYQYFIPILRKLISRFSWGGFGATLSRLKKLEIIIPIDENNSLDLNYIENFIKSIYKKNNLKISNKEVSPMHKKTIDKNAKKMKLFPIHEVFDTYNEKGLILNSTLLEEPGKMPYIGAKKNDNGVMKMVSSNQYSDKITKGNCLVWIRQGEGSSGYSTYQENDFYCASTNQVLRRNNLNKFHYLYLVTIIDRQFPRYNFGRALTLENIKKTEILLPVDENDKIDFRWMEDYMKSLKFSKLL